MDPILRAKLNKGLRKPVDEISCRLQSRVFVSLPLYSEKYSTPTSSCPKIFSKIYSSGAFQGPWTSVCGKKKRYGAFLLLVVGIQLKGPTVGPNCVTRFDLSLVGALPLLRYNYPGPDSHVVQLITTIGGS